MERTLVQSESELPRFDRSEPLFVDLETTSFDDDARALDPFAGHRAAGYAVCTHDGACAWYVPVRHHGTDVAECANRNLDLTIVKRWLQDVLCSGRDVHNHNVKFDARFWHFDGARVRGRLVDTLTLARLVDNDKLSYSLDALTGAKTGGEVKSYLKQAKSKDYGRCPIDLMARYAMNDVAITAKLERDLLRKLDASCADVWDVEQRLCGLLLDAEVRGIRVNKRRLADTWRSRLAKAIDLEEQVHEASGVVFDVQSDKEVAMVMEGRLGVRPVAWTKTGNPQWNAEALSMVHHPVAKLLAECRKEYHFCSLFCEGWAARTDSDGRMHANFNQAGTRTGRLSSSNPNLQNANAAAKLNVEADDGCNVVSSDFSQIEYRLFGHYANDPDIVEAYRQDARQDYHQALADMLGLSRRVAKTMNFALLYGMGKRKLLRKLSVMLAEDADGGMRDKLRSFLPDHKGELLPEHYDRMAAGVFEAYHERVPAVRRLSRRVRDKIEACGWIRNWRGRVYRFRDPELSYKGLNYLIQGSAADVFKDRLLAVMEAFPYARLITNVHDDCVFSVPQEKTEEFVRGHREVLIDAQPAGGATDLRVPLAVETKVGRRVWGHAQPVGEDLDVRDALRRSVEAENAAETSTQNPVHA